jgi:hypothetical protein
MFYTFCAQFGKHSQQKMSIRIYTLTVDLVKICGVKYILRLAAYTNIRALDICGPVHHDIIYENDQKHATV